MPDSDLYPLDRDGPEIPPVPSLSTVPHQKARRRWLIIIALGVVVLAIVVYIVFLGH